MLIADRTLKIRRPEGDRQVIVRLFAPERCLHDWRCQYEIEWPDGPARFAAHGIDSIQALVLALQMISGELYASKPHRLGRLQWNSSGDGYGFPPPPNIRDELTGEDRRSF